MHLLRGLVRFPSRSVQAVDMGRLLARFLSRVVHNEAMQNEYACLKKESPLRRQSLNILMGSPHEIYGWRIIALSCSGKSLILPLPISPKRGKPLTEI